NLDLAEVPLRTGDNNGRMALLGGEAQQTAGTTRFIVGMRMHHHEGMGLPDHGRLVCEPPHPRPGARSHGSSTPAMGGGRATRAGGVPSWRRRVVVVPPTCTVSLEDRHGCGEQPAVTPCNA